MKFLYSIIVGLLFFVNAYSQNTHFENDSTVISLKRYLEKNIIYPAAAIKDYTQGRLIITFHISDHQTIDRVEFVRHLTYECDSAVMKVMNTYSQKVLLPPASYTIVLRFFLLEKGKPDSEITPVDKNRYFNFLFELNVTAELPMEKHRVQQY